MEKQRCRWVKLSNPAYVAYHDKEWGTPTHNDRALFEMLVLEGFQAGLAWETIINKREGFRRAFEGFDPARVAAFDEAKRAELMADPGIVRNRLKINAAVNNARIFLDIRREFGSFDAYIWGFTGGRQLHEPWDERTTSPLSDAISKDLKKRGMKFVGSTIIYSYLQAIGVLDPHTPECYRAKKA